MNFASQKECIDAANARARAKARACGWCVDDDLPTTWGLCLSVGEVHVVAAWSPPEGLRRLDTVRYFSSDAHFWGWVANLEQGVGQ